MRYGFESLNRLRDSLDATGVLSKDYRSTVLGWALSACSEAAEAAKAHEQMRWLANDQVWGQSWDGGSRRGVIREVRRVRKPSPAYDAGHRDEVLLHLDSVPSEVIRVPFDVLQREWRRVA